MTQILNIAHRGASGREPENTLRAFEAARVDGADGIELDIFLSADQKIIVTHDQNTARLTGQKFNVRKTKLATLQTLDYGKGEVIPTLTEVFDRFLDSFAVINVEIKSTGVRTDGIEAKLAHLIQKYNGEEKILVSSFNPFNLLRFKKILPKVRIGYLIEPKFKVLNSYFKTIQWLKPDTLNMHPALFTNEKSKLLFDLGLPIWIWGANTPSEWRDWAQRGVQAVINDEPKLFRDVMKG